MTAFPTTYPVAAARMKLAGVMAGRPCFAVNTSPGDDLALAERCLR